MIQRRTDYDLCLAHRGLNFRSSLQALQRSPASEPGFRAPGPVQAASTQVCMSGNRRNFVLTASCSRKQEAHRSVTFTLWGDLKILSSQTTSESHLCRVTRNKTETRASELCKAPWETHHAPKAESCSYRCFLWPLVACR